jgi:hypothetical protein
MILLFISRFAYSQFSVGVSTCIPDKNLSFVSEPGFGAMISRDFKRSDRINVFASFGMNDFLPKTQGTLSYKLITFPIQAGVKFHPFNERLKCLFVQATCGTLLLYNKEVDDNFYYKSTNADTEWDFSYAPSLGISIKSVDFIFTNQYIQSPKGIGPNPATYLIVGLICKIGK